MPRFSRNTIIKLVKEFHFSTHAQMNLVVLKFELEDADAVRGSGIEPREVSIIRYLVDNPERIGPSGANLIYELIEFLLEKRLTATNWYAGEKEPEEELPNLVHSLKRDGYIIENKRLKTMLPGELQIAESEDEMSTLLDKFEFTTTKGHYLQAVRAHTRGDWASANSQLRTFIESLFDSIAEYLIEDKSKLPTNSHQRREFLSKTDPPFFLSGLNEWDEKGKGFAQGFWNRLHPEGAHPGLSDEEDSTFRLHMVILTSSHYLRRLDARIDLASNREII
jgi:hypothetical protein